MNLAKAEHQIRETIQASLEHGVPPGHLIGLLEIIKSDIHDILRAARIQSMQQAQPRIVTPNGHVRD